MSQTIAEALANALQARNSCIASRNEKWADTWHDRIDSIVSETAPSGSGIDMGTSFDGTKSTPEKLAFYLAFHHMNEQGYYDGWTEHTVTAKPSFIFGIDLKISGRNRNEIKDYLADVYHDWLTSEAPEIKPDNS